MKYNLETEEVKAMSLKFRFKRPTASDEAKSSLVPPLKREMDILRRVDDDEPLTKEEAKIFCLGLLTYKKWSVNCPGEEAEWLETTEEVQEYLKELRIREEGRPQGVQILSPAENLFEDRISMPGSLLAGFDLDYPVPWLKGGDGK